MATESERLKVIETHLELEELNTNFCYFLDHGDIESLVNLFTEDAEYTHGTRRSIGQDEIRALFGKRAEAGVRTARHMYSGLKITIKNSHQATGHSVCMTFAKNAEPPIVPALPYLVADFMDEYVYCDDDCWRIGKRHIERIFLDPENQSPVGQESSDQEKP